jgi:class 3 adenylate cyclase
MRWLRFSGGFVRSDGVLVICAACHAANDPGAKFCVDCGTRLASTCPACGTPFRAEQRFCGECGTPLVAVPPPEPAQGEPVSERKHVSVLFADLVGFTSHSERRDAEDVRELPSRYFDACRRVIDRYGGTVEKFIGDAVMAVWGTPVAQEDDAERAVRVALDIVDAVRALGQEVGAPELAARAGVLTGEAVVTLGAQGQGLVAGDLVNTAARVQAAAEPGTVLVGEATRSSSDAAVAYEEAGTHELKGKAEPVRLFRALRVVALRGGESRSEGLEAPFVGRDGELRLLKELLHATAEEGRARLAAVNGIAGIGKSRLVWELEKYVDGLAEDIRWHAGRCLAYGEGVTYWPLAEMVRTRADIVEGEQADTARAKLRLAVEEAIADPEERAFVEPRLLHLLGLEERTAPDKHDLFAGWRLFYERLAEQMPTVLVFEDMQWADPSLVEFVDYLLEWSRGYALLVVALARPEGAPSFGAARISTQLALEPLQPRAMEALLDGLVPGLPGELRARILDRAEGVPLYAVETVRMLLDRGLLERADMEYRPTATIGELEVPETLHALLAARLDGLAPDERALVQDASVLGKTFVPAAVAHLGGRDEADVERLLASLVAKEVLELRQDPRSPERGQVAFLQDLVRQVAFETLAHRDRRARHLAAADFLREHSGYDPDEIAEVLAVHYLEAWSLAPDAPDAPMLRRQALDAIGHAAERARSLAAAEEAARLFDRASGLTDDVREQADLQHRAGEAAAAADAELARRHYARALELYESAGDLRATARVQASVVHAAVLANDFDVILELSERAYRALGDGERDADFAAVAAARGRALALLAGPLDALPVLEDALGAAERWDLPEVYVDALNSRGTALGRASRLREAELILRSAEELARTHKLPGPTLRALNNHTNVLQQLDRMEEARSNLERGLGLARLYGHSVWFELLGTELVMVEFLMGDWEQADARAREMSSRGEIPMRLTTPYHVHLLVAQGRLAEARAALDVLGYPTPDPQDIAAIATARSLVLRVEGDAAGALAEAERGIATRDALGVTGALWKFAWVETVESAFAAGDERRAAELLRSVAGLAPGERTPYLVAEADRLGARLDEADADARLRRAIAVFRELALPFHAAIAQLELAERGPGDAEALAREAAAEFERLGAAPWLERALGLGYGFGPASGGEHGAREHEHEADDHAERQPLV